MRRKTGSVYRRKNGRWYARVTWTDANGKKSERVRSADSKVHACALRDDLVRTVNAGIDPSQNSKSFAELADYFAGEYLIKATYRGDSKVAGMRSLPTYLGFMATLRDHFGPWQLHQIGYEDVRQFRQKRLRTETKHGQPRSVASVNRELSFLRRIFRVGVRKGWMPRSPFELGEPLISVADEKARERILSVEEESRLLAACEAPGREHLRAIVVAALDTGCRRGELFSLRWSDVNLEGRVLTVRAMNSKTLRARNVPITGRLAVELSRLREAHPIGDGFVFGGITTVKRSWRGATRDAELIGLRLHDLRHTAATRLVRGHLPLGEVGRVLGHTQARTTYRYLNSDQDTLSRAGSILDAYGASESIEGDAVN